MRCRNCGFELEDCEPSPYVSCFYCAFGVFSDRECEEAGWRRISDLRWPTGVRWEKAEEGRQEGSE